MNCTITSTAPPTVRAEAMNDSSGMATKASANGRMKPSTIWPMVGMRASQLSLATAACAVASDCISACLSAISMSRISASAASMPARVSSNVKAIHSMRLRIVSGNAWIFGNRCVMRSVSIKNSPMVASTKMITSAATSEVRSEAVR